MTEQEAKTVVKDLNDKSGEDNYSATYIPILDEWHIEMSLPWGSRTTLYMETDERMTPREIAHICRERVRLASSVFLSEFHKQI